MKTMKRLAGIFCGSFLLCSGLSATADTPNNPVIWADVPDVAVIRTGDTYYMSSTTMHLSPGLPIMKSKDLINWEMASYAYDVLGEQDALWLRNGKSAYGSGSWASSLRFHKGSYYVSTFAQTTGKTYIFKTENIEKGPWQEFSFRPMMHDHSLHFEEDGRVFMIYGSNDIRIRELKADLSGVKEGGIDQVLVPNVSAVTGKRTGLPAEGSHFRKIDGKYYLFNITWPPGDMRTQTVFRSDNLLGPYEGKVAFTCEGIAQGGLVDTPEGKWYALLFGDRGAVGRIPYLVPVEWKEGWPILGKEGKELPPLEIDVKRYPIPSCVASDEFERKEGEAPLPLQWQWNHAPENSTWSLDARSGWMRLTTSRTDADILSARNTLTQRTFGPQSCATISLDTRNMKEGDIAGLCAFQKFYSYVGVKKTADGSQYVMLRHESGKPVEVESLPCTEETAFLKVECDFQSRPNRATFFYSPDGKEWKSIGKPAEMSYTIPHFMGYRFAIFNFATQTPGGFVDMDYFRVGIPQGKEASPTQ